MKQQSKGGRQLDKKEESQFLQKALPLEQPIIDEEEYVLEEGDSDAVQYLLQVRTQIGDPNQVIKSKKYEKYSEMQMEFQDNTGRDYLHQSLSRLYFTASEQYENDESINSKPHIYQDQDMVFNKNKNVYQQTHWDQKWLDQVLYQKTIMREKILKVQKENIKPQDKIRQSDKYLQFIEQRSQKKELPSEIDIARASEVVLHDIFGLLVLEKEDQWDQKETEIPMSDLLWIYGLLCLLEKPLLPDQAGDLNLLLNLLLKQKQSLEQGKSQNLLAQLDINIAIITEYFEQRFK